MKENLDLLENKEDSDGFCGELRMRNFDFLGKLKPWGFTGEVRMRIFDLQEIRNSDKFMLGVMKALRIFNLLGDEELCGDFKLGS